MFATRAAAAAASLVLVMGPLAACSSGAVSTTADQPLSAPEPGGQADTSTSTTGRTDSTESTESTQQQADRDVVRTATLSVVVEDPDTAGGTIEQKTKAVGGYVAKVTTTAAKCASEPCPAGGGSESGSAVTGLTMTVRVPAARYDEVVAAIRDLGEVAALDVTAVDVTAQVVDLDARIESQRASVARMRQLLQQADTIDEMVRVEGELSQRQADLESMVSQRKRLADQVALATITTTLVAREQAEALLPAESHWWDDAWDAFTQSWRGLLVALAAVSPLLIMLGIAGAIVLLVLRLRAKPAPSGPDESATTGDRTPSA